MRDRSAQDVTRLLQEWSLGEEEALQRLIPLVYQELHRLAHCYMKREAEGHVLQTTALINEACIRLMDLDRIHWQNRNQFLGVSAQVMRRVLVDFARTRNAKKRGGDIEKVTLNEDVVGEVGHAVDIEALDEALVKLAGEDSRKARVVELRFFGGFSVNETAEILGISPETVMRDWRFAKAWLLREVENY